MSCSIKRKAWFAPLLALGMGLTGCQAPALQPVSRGVSVAPRESGSLHVAIRWPQRDERRVMLVPLGAEEALLTALDAQGGTVATLLVRRDGSTSLANARMDLPVGLDYRLSVTMKGPDGQAMAAGVSGLFVIKQNQATEVPVRLDPIIETVAGTGIANHVGEGIPATGAAIQNPSTVATDAAGNIYVTVRKSGSMDGNVIRKIDPNGIITTVVGLPPSSSEPYLQGDGVPARNTQLLSPIGLSVSAEGDMLIGDEVPGASPREYRLLFIPARDGRRFGLDMKAGCSYRIHTAPHAFASVLLGPDGTAYASLRNWVIRVDASRTAVTIAGIEGLDDPIPGKDEKATESGLKTPDGLALDRLGNLFIADRNNHRIRLLCKTPGIYYGIPMQSGWIYTIAGLKVSEAWQRTSATFPYQDGLQGLESSLNFPRGLVFDDRGNLYLSDATNNMIRRLSPDGKLLTMAGRGVATRWYDSKAKIWVNESLGDGGSSLEATFYSPAGLAIGIHGGLYVADSANNLVRRLHI